MAECGTPVARNIRGIVISLNNRYGYINSENYPHVFFHRSQVDSDSWNSLETNDEVVFDVHRNDMGWKAYAVGIVRKYYGKTGRVKWFNHSKGFGYIATDMGDLKVTRRDILPGMFISAGDNVKVDFEKSSRYSRLCRVEKHSRVDNDLDSYHLVQAELQCDLLSLSPTANSIGVNQNSLPFQASASANLDISPQPSSHDPFKDIVGSVVFWNRRRNFGFLKCPQGKVFIHRNELTNGYNFLDRGDVVTFDIESSDRGYKAVNVRFIPDDATPDNYLSDESEYGATAAYNPFEDFLTNGYISSSSSEFQFSTTSHLYFPLPDTPVRSGRRRNRRRSKGASEVESGYDSSRFVDDRIPQQLICPICLGVFNEPMSAPCEHAFCKGCIYRWLREDDLCPVDRQSLDEDDLKPLPLLLRGILGQLRIRCSHSGCESIVNLDDIKDHESKCEFQKTVSQSSASGGTRKLL